MNVNYQRIGWPRCQRTNIEKSVNQRKYDLGGRSSVVRASELQPGDHGFDPLAGQEKHSFFLSLRFNSCADLFVADPLRVCGKHPHLCAC